jgi:hypothetical protein
MCDYLKNSIRSEPNPDFLFGFGSATLDENYYWRRIILSSQRVQYSTEATSLESKIPVFGKSLVKPTFSYEKYG